MPIIKSAKKRVRTAEKATIRNVKVKRSLRSAVKAFRSAITGAEKDASTKLSEAQSRLDTAVKKGIMHKNKAARQLAQLAKEAKNASTEVAAPAKKKAATKAPAKKATSKPATVKSTGAKKPAAAKKAPARKPAAKKTDDK